MSHGGVSNLNSKLGLAQSKALKRVAPVSNVNQFCVVVFSLLLMKSRSCYFFKRNFSLNALLARTQHGTFSFSKFYFERALAGI